VNLYTVAIGKFMFDAVGKFRGEESASENQTACR
jgi:hypothetical protein